MDLALFVTLTASFALLVTVHVAISVGLLRRAPWWRGAAALLVPPLAPYFGLEAGMRVRALLWALALSVYVVARMMPA